MPISTSSAIQFKTSDLILLSKITMHNTISNFTATSPANFGGDPFDFNSVTLPTAPNGTSLIYKFFAFFLNDTAGQTSNIRLYDVSNAVAITGSTLSYSFATGSYLKYGESGELAVDPTHVVRAQASVSANTGQSYNYGINIYAKVS